MHKTYWFPQFKLMKEVRDSFCDWLKTGQDEAYFTMLHQIRTVSGAIDAKQMDEIGEELSDSQMAHDAWKYYNQIWNKK